MAIVDDDGGNGSQADKPAPAVPVPVLLERIRVRLDETGHRGCAPPPGLVPWLLDQGFAVEVGTNALAPTRRCTQLAEDAFGLTLAQRRPLQGQSTGMSAARRAAPSAALAEMLDQTGELDEILSGRGLAFVSTPTAPAPAPAPLYIPKADWHEEARDRRAAERAARARQDATRLEAPEPPPRPTLPARPRRRRPWAGRDTT